MKLSGVWSELQNPPGSFPAALEHRGQLFSCASRPLVPDSCLRVGKDEEQSLEWLMAQQQPQWHWIPHHSCAKPLTLRGIALLLLSLFSHTLFYISIASVKFRATFEVHCLKQSCHQISWVASMYFKPFLYLTSNCQNRLYATDLYQSLIFSKPCLTVPSCKDIQGR